MSTIQILWLVFIGEGNLQCKIREGYIITPKHKGFKVNFARARGSKKSSWMSNCSSIANPGICAIRQVDVIGFEGKI
jgi:hypothetical protein